MGPTESPTWIPAGALAGPMIPTTAYIDSGLPVQRNDEVHMSETKVTFSLGSSERFWESDHIREDVEQQLLRYP